MIKIWGKTLKKNKIMKSHMVQKDGILTESVVFDCVDTICKEFDIARPIMLDKHRKDMHEFFLMRFFPDDFIEKVDFEKFEIEIYIEKK